MHYIYVFYPIISINFIDLPTIGVRHFSLLDSFPPSKNDSKCYKKAI